MYSEVRDSARNDLPEHVTAREKPVLATSPHLAHTHKKTLRSSEGCPGRHPRAQSPAPAKSPVPSGCRVSYLPLLPPGREYQGGPEPQNCWSLETTLSVPALPPPRWASTPTAEAPYSRHPKTHQPRFPPTTAYFHHRPVACVTRRPLPGSPVYIPLALYPPETEIIVPHLLPACRRCRVFQERGLAGLGRPNRPEQRGGKRRPSAFHPQSFPWDYKSQKSLRPPPPHYYPPRLVVRAARTGRAL